MSSFSLTGIALIPTLLTLVLLVPFLLLFHAFQFLRSLPIRSSRRGIQPRHCSTYQASNSKPSVRALIALSHPGRPLLDRYRFDQVHLT